MRRSDVLIRPIISEKILKGVQAGWYGFVVDRRSDKIGVKSAVESAFGVDVIEIRLLSKKGKKVRDINIKNRLVKNKRADLKKAYVKLKSGQVINLLGDESDEKGKKKTKAKENKKLENNRNESKE